MKFNNIDTQITQYESILDSADSGEDTGQIPYKLAKLKFDRQLIIVKELLDKISARLSTRELLNKYLPIKF